LLIRTFLLKQLRRLDPRKLSLTKRAGEAETLARAAFRAGCDYIIAAGGDGTLNERRKLNQRGDRSLTYGALQQLC
jgi:diacylglycerol kinase family enzyme